MSLRISWKAIIPVFLFLFLTGLLAVYFFVPFSNIEFIPSSRNSNFTLPTYGEEMQFYHNLRYPDRKISYNIDNTCSLSKKNEMETAIRWIDNLTILDFYSTNDNPEIIVTCSEENVIKEHLFVAGEGGPSKIIAGDNFNVIFEGKILLIRDSQCPKPNVAIHELLHVLGFKHSENSNNIMYNITKCRQVVGEDMIDLINTLYLIDSLPDLKVENTSAKISGAYLEIDLTIKNYGLKDSEIAEVGIYAEEKLVKKIELESIKVGEGRIINVKNIFLTNPYLKEIEFKILTNFDEISKSNNNVKLGVKN